MTIASGITIHRGLRPAVVGAGFVAVCWTCSGTITDWPQNRHVTTLPASRLYSSGPLQAGQLNVFNIINLALIDTEMARQAIYNT